MSRPFEAQLAEWAAESLSGETAPLLAQLTQAQLADGAHNSQEAKLRWLALDMLCRQRCETAQARNRPGSSQLQRPDSPFDDGPIAVRLHQVESQPRFAATAGSLDPVRTMRPSHSGSSLVPGPGAYHPSDAVRGRMSIGPKTGAGGWGSEDRLKHLARTTRKGWREQADVLPEARGHVPAFYCAPEFTKPKPGGKEPRPARMFQPASDLPAGSPPKRIASAVRRARVANALPGPPPGAYEPPVPLPNKLAGRFRTLTGPRGYQL
jgi:hypothetical protein